MTEADYAAIDNDLEAVETPTTPGWEDELLADLTTNREEPVAADDDDEEPDPEPEPTPTVSGSQVLLNVAQVEQFCMVHEVTDILDELYSVQRKLEAKVLQMKMAKKQTTMDCFFK
jgi:hypothetical protein